MSKMSDLDIERQERERAEYIEAHGTPEKSSTEALSDSERVAALTPGTVVYWTQVTGRREYGVVRRVREDGDLEVETPRSRGTVMIGRVTHYDHA